MRLVSVIISEFFSLLFYFYYSIYNMTAKFTVMQPIPNGWPYERNMTSTADILGQSVAFQQIIDFMCTTSKESKQYIRFFRAALF